MNHMDARPLFLRGVGEDTQKRIILINVRTNYKPHGSTIPDKTAKEPHTLTLYTQHSTPYTLNPKPHGSTIPEKTPKGTYIQIVLFLGVFFGTN